MLRVCHAVLFACLAVVTPYANANYIYEILPVELPDGSYCCPEQPYSAAITGGFIETNINNGILTEDNIVAFHVDLNGGTSYSSDGSLLFAHGMSITPTSISILGDMAATLDFSYEGEDDWSSVTWYYSPSVESPRISIEVDSGCLGCLSFAYASAKQTTAAPFEIASSSVIGDCIADGRLTADDLVCVSTIRERDAVLGALNTLPGDLNGDGQVAFADFLTLSQNYGKASDVSYSLGDIDLDGQVQLADFLMLSQNFGKTVVAAAVPEPSSFVLLLAGCLAIRRRRNRLYVL